MTSVTRKKHLASPPPLDAEATPTEDEVRAYTPAQAAQLLNVTENWVKEHMDDESIPFCYVGRFRRMRLRHIRAVLEEREVDPKRRGRKPPQSLAA